MAVEGKTHSEVVAAIKAGGSVTKLLVVDPDTDAFFKKCRVVPSLDHVTGESRVLWFNSSLFPGVSPLYTSSLRPCLVSLSALL